MTYGFSNGVLPANNGGTGRSTITTNALLAGNGAGNVLLITGGAAGTVLAGSAGVSSFTATPTLTSLTFGAGTALSNYAEGTFTPTLDGSVSGTTTYTVQQGYYTRIGNMVTCWGNVQGSSATGTANATLAGLPFTIKNQANYSPIGDIALSASTWAWPAGGTSANVKGVLNTLTALIFVDGTASAGGNLQMTNGAFSFQYTLTYQI